MSENTGQKKEKTLVQRWTDWLTGRSKTRPSNEASYGKGMDKVVMKLPRSVEEQFKIVNMMHLIEQYPNDYKARLEFFNMIAPYGSTLNQQVSMEILGYAGVETYISMYCDLLLRPLSQGAANKLEETILQILPEIADKTESTK